MASAVRLAWRMRFMFTDIADFETMLGRASVRIGGDRYGLILDKHGG